MIESEVCEKFTFGATESAFFLYHTNIQLKILLLLKLVRILVFIGTRKYEFLNRNDKKRNS